MMKSSLYSRHTSHCSCKYMFWMRIRVPKNFDEKGFDICLTIKYIIMFRFMILIFNGYDPSNIFANERNLFSNNWNHQKYTFIDKNFVNAKCLIWTKLSEKRTREIWWKKNNYGSTFGIRYMSLRKWLLQHFNLRLTIYDNFKNDFKIYRFYIAVTLQNLQNRSPNIRIWENYFHILIPSSPWGTW